MLPAVEIPLVQVQVSRAQVELVLPSVLGGVSAMQQTPLSVMPGAVRLGILFQTRLCESHLSVKVGLTRGCFVGHGPMCS